MTPLSLYHRSTWTWILSFIVLSNIVNVNTKFRWRWTKRFWYDLSFNNRRQGTTGITSSGKGSRRIDRMKTIYSFDYDRRWWTDGNHFLRTKLCFLALCFPMRIISGVDLEFFQTVDLHIIQRTTGQSTETMSYILFIH